MYRHFKRDFVAPLPVAALRKLAAGTARNRSMRSGWQRCSGGRWGKIDLRQAKITVLSPDQSRVEGVLYVLGGSPGLSSHRIVYDLMRRGSCTSSLRVIL